MGLSLPRPKRHAGGTDNLVGSQKALAVAGRQAQGAAWVELRQPLSERNATQSPMEFCRLSSDHFRDFRYHCQTLFKRPEIKAGATDDNRRAADGGGSGDFFQR